MTNIIKRHGHEEKFDERKVYASVFAACLTAHRNENHAEEVAEKVTEAVKKWLKAKKKVEAEDLYTAINDNLKKVDADAYFLYKTHRDIC